MAISISCCNHRWEGAHVYHCTLERDHEGPHEDILASLLWPDEQDQVTSQEEYIEFELPDP